MANTRPYTDAHAIAMIEVAVFFRPALSDKDLGELKRKMEIALKPKGFKRLTGKGVARFALRGPDKELIDEVHIHDTMMHAMTYEYRGWAVFRSLAAERLAAIASLPISRRSGVGLAVRDVFVNDSPMDYENLDVFSPRSRFLPAYVWEKGSQWRLSFTSHEQMAEMIRLSSTLFVDSRAASAKLGEDVRPVHTAEITHRQWYSLSKNAVSGDTFSDENALRRLDALYDRNKSLVRELLSERMLDQIGLKE